MPRRHVNGRRVLLQLATFFALVLVAALAVHYATAPSRGRVHVSRGGQPASTQQGQAVAIGVDPNTGDMSIVSRDRNGGVQQVTIPAADLQKSGTSPLPGGPKAGASGASADAGG
jgi:hypothetical protein